MTYSDIKSNHNNDVNLEWHVTQTAPIRSHVHTFDTLPEAREYARLWRDWNPHATCVVVGQGRDVEYLRNLEEGI